MQKNYAFGEFILRPGQRLLTRRSGEPIEIHAKAFDALVCLVRHRGEVVSRAELAHTLWPKVVVEDNNLSQVILALRRALGDTSPPYRFVTTVPRRGYQFVAAVIELPAEAPEILRPAPPRLASVALFISCAAILAVLVTATRWWRFSEEEAAISNSGRPVADRVVEGDVRSWPLPEIVACRRESARLMDAERCAAVFRSVQEAERRRSRGLYAT